MKGLLTIFIIALLLVSLVLMFGGHFVVQASEDGGKCDEDTYYKAGCEKYDHKIFASVDGD